MKPKTKTVCLISYLLLSVYIFAAAACIEFLNYQAGGILPRQEYYNNDPKQGLVKWRYNPAALDLKAVTESNSKSMSEMQAEKENRLHSAVIKFGLPQYPLLALAGLFFAAILFCGPSAYTRRDFYLITTCCLLNIVSFTALLERNYFSSLGW